MAASPQVILAGLPPAREGSVRAPDGIRLHVEEFGPEDGYPIVLSHGITCSIRVWVNQIADLATDHRVIAFDHRGHGTSDVPPRYCYSVDHLAGDLNAVLEATLRPGERAVLAGHSMGGIAIMAWSARYPEAVPRRADAVALINTTTGDLLRKLRLIPVPEPLADTRIRIARGVVRAIGPLRLPRWLQLFSREFIDLIAVGPEADPEITTFVHDMFLETSRVGRAACARKLAETMDLQHISLAGLTVPTLVIGGRHDRLLPMIQSRKIAAALPNLAGLVELPGGHCSILENPHEVNTYLRVLTGVGIAADDQAGA